MVFDRKPTCSVLPFYCKFVLQASLEIIKSAWLAVSNVPWQWQHLGQGVLSVLGEGFHLGDHIIPDEGRYRSAGPVVAVT
jgi:hypothetical protein